jgi:hypothetical protein
LKIRSFRFLFVADFFGFLGFNTRMMVQGWIVLELTHSDGWVGLAAGLPATPVMPLRCSARRLLTGSTVA